MNLNTICRIIANDLAKKAFDPPDLIHNEDPRIRNLDHLPYVKMKDGWALATKHVAGSRQPFRFPFTARKPRFRHSCGPPSTAAAVAVAPKHYRPPCAVSRPCGGIRRRGGRLFCACRWVWRGGSTVGLSHSLVWKICQEEGDG